MSIEAELLTRLSALLGRRDLTQVQFSDWAGGSADGGPDGDGAYPLSDSTGFERKVPSPASVAKIAEDLEATVASAPALAPPAFEALPTISVGENAKTFRTSGRLTPGDGGDALVGEVADGPETPWRKKDASGRTFAIVEQELRVDMFEQPQHAFMASLDLGRPLVLRERDRPLILGDLLDTPVWMVAENASLFRPATTPKPDPLLRIRFSYTFVTAVISVTPVELQLNSSPTNLSYCTRVSVVAGSPILAALLAGDAIKLVANTFIPSSIASDMERLGEHMTVLAVDQANGWIDLLGRPFEDWSVATGIRIAKMNRKPCRIEGDLTFGQVPSATIRHSGPLIYIEGGSPHIHGFAGRDAKCPAIELASCYEADIESEAYDLGTSSVASQLGYGVALYASKSCRVRARGARVRHLGTTGSRSVAEANDPRIERYGAGIDNKFYIDAWECYGPAADEHSDGLANVWTGTIVGSNPSDNTSMTCTQFRGRQTTADMVTRGLTASKVRIYNGPANGGHRLKFRHTRPESYNSFRPIVAIEGDETTIGARVQLELDFIGEGEVNIVEASYADVYVPRLQADHRLTPLSDSGNRSSVLRALAGANIVADRVVIDWSRSTNNSNNPAIGRASIGTSIIVRSADVKMGAGFWFIGDLGAALSATVIIHSVNADKLPAVQTGGIGPGYSSTSALDYRIGYDLSINGVRQRDAVRTRASAASITLQSNSEAVQEFTAPIGSTQTITLLPGGWRNGQEIVLVRSASATGTGRYDVIYEGAIIAVLSTAGQTVRLKFNDAATPVPRVLLSGPPTGSKTFNWPVIAPGNSSSTTVAVTTAVTGDRAVASMSSGSGGLILFAEATAADTVTVTAFNPTSAAIDLASATLTASLVR